MTPTRFKLTKQQIARYERWKESLRKRNEAYFESCAEEDCAPMSPFTFHFTPGSISDDVVVTCKIGVLTYRLDISEDDDGKFVNPFPDLGWRPTGYAR